MGWTSCRFTKGHDKLVDKIGLAGQHKREDGIVVSYTPLLTHLKNGVLYAAIETKHTNETGVVVAQEIWAAIVLIRWSKDYYNFSYKDMDETCHPYYHDCPNKILDMLSEPPNQNAIEWRAICRTNNRIKDALKRLAKDPNAKTKFAAIGVELHDIKPSHKYCIIARVKGEYTLYKRTLDQFLRKAEISGLDLEKLAA
jgi:hypothetical protein